MKPVQFTTEEILDNVTPVPEAGCWLWNGGWDSNGHGKVRRGLKNRVSSHRFFYEKIVGTIPQGMHVLYKCDVPACCNPSHLYLGTHSQNMKDMWDRKRARPGVVESRGRRMADPHSKSGVNK